MRGSSAGSSMTTSGGLESTLTLRGVLLPALPAASTAVATRESGPSDALTVTRNSPELFVDLGLGRAAHLHHGRREVVGDCPRDLDLGTEDPRPFRRARDLNDRGLLVQDDAPGRGARVAGGVDGLNHDPAVDDEYPVGREGHAVERGGEAVDVDALDRGGVLDGPADRHCVRGCVEGVRGRLEDEDLGRLGVEVRRPRDRLPAAEAVAADHGEGIGPLDEGHRTSSFRPVIVAGTVSPPAWHATVTSGSASATAPVTVTGLPPRSRRPRARRSSRWGKRVDAEGA